jgi:hypothetical protein
MTLFQGFTEHYHEELQQKIQSLDEVLVRGNFDSLTEYKQVVGERKGLIFALERHKELISLMEHDE